MRRREEGRRREVKSKEANGSHFQQTPVVRSSRTLQ